MYEIVLYVQMERSLWHMETYATYATKAQCEAHLLPVREVIGDTQSRASAHCRPLVPRSIFSAPMCLVTGGGKS